MPLRTLRSSGHTPSLFAALLHFDTSFMIWVLLSSLGAYVAADLGLSPAQKGLMVAVPPLGGAMFRLLLGPVVDHFGARRTGLATMSLTLIPLTLGWLSAHNYIQVLLIGLMLGLSGASFVIALPLASRWYPPEHQGIALGIVGAGNSGTLITALFAPRLAEHVGWHGVFGLAMIPLIVVWLTFALLAKEPPRPASSSPSLRSTLGLLEHADARSLCAFYLVTFGGFVGLAGYLPIFFVDQFGLTKVTSGTYTAVCAVAGSFLRPVGGALADKFGGTRVLTAVYVFVGLLAAALATSPPLGVTTTLLFLTLGALGLGNGAVFQLVPQRFGARVGSITGLVGAAGGVGGFLLPFALGSLAGATGDHAAGFMLLTLVASVAAFAVVRRQQVWRLNWNLEVAV